MAHRSPLGFFDLPAEIRVFVYGLLLLGGAIVERGIWGNRQYNIGLVDPQGLVHPPSLSAQLCRVSKQFHIETRPILYGGNKVRARTSRPAYHRMFCEFIGQKNRLFIRHLEIGFQLVPSAPSCHIADWENFRSLKRNVLTKFPNLDVLRITDFQSKSERWNGSNWSTCQVKYARFVLLKLPRLSQISCHLEGVGCSVQFTVPGAAVPREDPIVDLDKEWKACQATFAAEKEARKAKRKVGR